MVIVVGACGGGGDSAISAEPALTIDVADGSNGDGDGSSGVANPLCPDSDTATPPADFPFSKPPSLNAVAYDVPSDPGSNVYELRGGTFDPDAVIEQLMNVVFPDAVFTAVSDVPGQEAFDFVDPLGTGEYISITSGCTNVGIILRMGASAPDAEADHEATSSDVVTEGGEAIGDGDANGDTEDPGDPGDGNSPSITVLTETGTFEPTATTCAISSQDVEIVASGDGVLTVTGDANSLTVDFVDPDGTQYSVSEPGFGVSPGTLQFVASTGFLVSVEGC